MKRKPKVYIAGPYTKGDVALNVKNAVGLADRLVGYGCIPFVPHFLHFWHMMFPHKDEQYWLDYDNEWLLVCDALFRIPGDSKGAEAEVELARQSGIPVFHTLFDLSCWFQARKGDIIKEEETANASANK